MKTGCLGFVGERVSLVSSVCRGSLPLNIERHQAVSPPHGGMKYCSERQKQNSGSVNPTAAGTFVSNQRLFACGGLSDAGTCTAVERQASARATRPSLKLGMYFSCFGGPANYPLRPNSRHGV